ncbi:MAG: signal recognition particle-docking protein FtsY [Oscillatoriaceae cyanobacterium Prado104]|jgi:fused signal recognition particle receptor|nr:signal recognition particle-docking protein FtsY [Oscillatoriaceae cyanobacterium Prado104]
MVFNWFRRQYSDSGSSEPETPSEQPQDTPPASPKAEPATDAAPPTAEPNSPAVAEDYLAWAKAAYKNIQKQQQSETQVSETAETPQPETETAAPTEVSATPQPEVVTETPAEISATSQPEAITETPAEISATSQPEAETASPAQVSETPEPPAAEISAETASIAQTQEIAESTSATVPTAEIAEIPPAPPEAPEIAPPVAELIAVPTENLEITEPATSAAATPAPGDGEPVPFWAKAQAERLERIERLKETAIEEPEPVAATAPPVTVEPEIPEFVLDEGFLWSSEILASQGRRPDQVSVEEITWLQKLRKGLERTRRSLINQLKAIVGQGPLNQDAVAEIESLLLQADVGVAATDIIIDRLQARLREEALPPEQAIAYLKTILRDLLDAPCAESAAGNPAYSLTFAPEKDTFNLWLIVGVNGAGKTTTIGKLAHIAQKSGYKTLIAAADTFRAAAVEQVKVWGSRSGVEIIANPGKNTDPAAVVFDAIEAAQSRGTELLIVDTAGRLQNKKNLMDELSKIRRIADKKAPGATVESLLVLDATLGQNGLRQAEVFAEAAKLSGVVLTKLDGTAKGGVALAVVQQLGLPIRFIGVGESIEDLRPFSSYEFVEALLDFRF